MPARILLIDNYDSFVFNLARYLEELGCETEVRRNDAVSVEEILQTPPAAIILSPGPCTPYEAGICVELIRANRGSIPLLGVCLGHQAIGAAFGGKVVRAPEPMHGRVSQISHDASSLFTACPAPLTVARYHSLIVERSTLPASLQITAETSDGIIMAVQHVEWPVFGVQFHPESILTQHGHQLLWNFLKIAGLKLPCPTVEAELPLPTDSVDDFYRREFDATSWRPL